MAREAIFDDHMRLRVDAALHLSDAVGQGATGRRNADTRLRLAFCFTDLG